MRHSFRRPLFPLRSFLVVLGFAWLVVVRAAGAQVYVANSNADSVLVFDPAQNGNVAPLQNATSTPVGMDLPTAVAVDVRRGEIFLADRSLDSIYVLPLNANGSTTLLRRIAGAATTIDSPTDIEIDHERGEIYVLSGLHSEILVFPIDADGNVAPTRVLETLPNWDPSTVGFALDLVNDEILVADRTPGIDGVLAFPRDSDGFVSVSRSITGAATGLTDPFGIAVDPLNDEIYVTQSFSIRVFPRTGHGNVAPLRTLLGAATTLSANRSVDVDPIAGEISVIRQSPAHALLFFPRTANGNVAPTRTITGALTGLNNPDFHAYFPWIVFADGFEDSTTDGWPLP